MTNLATKRINRSVAMDGEDWRTTSEKAYRAGIKAIKLLAELVAWDGCEDNYALAKRKIKAERWLKKNAPEVLAAANAAVPEDCRDER
jgi:hypothetical protein